jgi:phosphonate transport system substrate-binding protein
MNQLTITSCQSPLAELHVALLAKYLARYLGIAVRFVNHIPWQERSRLLDTGEIDVAWICGAPYVRRTVAPSPAVVLLAAPVQTGERYSDRPIYFSDVVVGAASSFRSFVQLRGTRWGYNEPASHSGYVLFRSYLAERGETVAFFGSLMETGAHHESLAHILAGTIDAAAIDSTVLELLLGHQPELATHIRVIETMGPSSAPPWVASHLLDTTLREQVRQALLAAHTNEQGRAALAAGGIARFAAVDDSDYNDIRRMVRLAEGAH